MSSTAPGTATSPVAQWATECLVSLLALWCRTEMPHMQQPAASAGGEHRWGIEGLRDFAENFHDIPFVLVFFWRFLG